GQLAVAQPAILDSGSDETRSKMSFITRNGRLEPVFARTLGEPVRVVPLIRFQVGDDGAGVGAQLTAESVRIGFQGKHVSCRPDDFEFVDGAFGQFWNEDFPDAGRAARTHCMDTAVPAIEVADDADPASAGRPDGKLNAADACERDEVRAELLVSVVMAAFAHEIQVKLGEDAGKSIRIVKLKSFAVMGADLNSVDAGWRRASVACWQDSFKKAFGAQFHRFDNFVGGGRVFRRARFERDASFLSPGEEKANRPTAVHGMRPEKAKGIGMTTGHHRVDLGMQARIAGSDRCRGRGSGVMFGQRRSLR